KRRQAGRVNINRAGRYRGSKRRLVRVTSQGSEQVASSVVQRVRQRDGQERAGIRSRRRCRAQDKHTPRQSLWVWPSLKYPSIISYRC
ncbi:unnamed protein product, partial [Staurois parvus]